MVRTRWTIHDVESLPDSLEDKRYEIIDGELYVSTQPHYFHQRLCVKLISALDVWSEATGLGETSVAPGVIFAEDNNVAPDVVWISAARVDSVLGEDGKLHGPPDLVIELVSPGATNEVRDREAKLLLYSRRGVQEYWIVDWRLRQIDVYRRQDQALNLVGAIIDDDILRSPLLPGFELSARRLFAIIRGE